MRCADVATRQALMHDSSPEKLLHPSQRRSDLSLGEHVRAHGPVRQVLSTPLIDLIALLRRLRMPETLLEIMVLCYRMLFVFSEAVHDTMTAQSARLGYATPRLVLRSHAGLVACLTVQIWQRARDLHSAALSRNNDGPLRFLEPEFAHKGRDLTIAALASSLLIALALGVR